MCMWSGSRLKLGNFQFRLGARGSWLGLKLFAQNWLNLEFDLMWSKVPAFIKFVKIETLQVAHYNGWNQKVSTRKALNFMKFHLIKVLEKREHKTFHLSKPDQVKVIQYRQSKWKELRNASATLLLSEKSQLTYETFRFYSCLLMKSLQSNGIELKFKFNQNWFSASGCVGENANKTTSKCKIV